MQNFFRLLLFFLLSCHGKQETKTVANKSKHLKQIKQTDNLFILEYEPGENIINIIAPENSDFELPVGPKKPKPIKFGDFNADNKEDILVYLGACGTGGCMYALFLKQYDNFYKLAFGDYLNHIEINVEENGLWTLESLDEFEPFNPHKLQRSIYKFDQNTNEYKLDTTFVFYPK